MANYKPIAKRNFSAAVPIKKTAKAAPTKPKPAPKPAPVKASQPTPSVPTGPYQSLVDLYNQQKNDLTSYHQQQQAALQGFTDAFMKYLSGLAPKVGSDYDSAINQTNNLAQTAATGLANLNPHGEASLLGGIGAPEAQQAQIAAQNQQAFGGGGATLYDVAGAIPGSNLASQKANQMAFLDTLPGITSLQGTQGLQALLSNQSKQYNDLLNSQTESLLKAQGGSTTGSASLKPTVRNFSDGTTRQYDPATGKWNVITTKAGGAPSSKAPTVKKIGGGYYQWSGKAWVKLADASPSDHFTTTTLSNGQKQTIINGKPVGKPWGPVKTKGAGSSARPRLYGNSSSGYFTYENGALQPVPGFSPSGKKGSSKAPSPSQVSITFNRATKAGHDALNQVTANIWAKTPGHDSVKGTPEYEKALQSQREMATRAFGTAMYRVISAIGPHLKAIGYNPSQVKQAAYQIVSSTISPPAGYKPPKVTANPNNASSTGGAAVNSNAVSTAISTATSQIGLPYVFGSESPGKSFDCSGLIQYAYAKAGIPISRDTYHQIHDGFEVNWRGQSDLRPGDLIFPTPHHVVMYIGNGQVVAAPHTGTQVQTQPVSNFLGRGTRVRRIVKNGLV